jgi:hypothetical protein
MWSNIEAWRVCGLLPVLNESAASAVAEYSAYASAETTAMACLCYSDLYKRLTGACTRAPYGGKYRAATPTGRAFRSD